MAPRAPWQGLGASWLLGSAVGIRAWLWEIAHPTLAVETPRHTQVLILRHYSPTWDWPPQMPLPAVSIGSGCPDEAWRA